MRNLTHEKHKTEFVKLDNIHNNMVYAGNHKHCFLGKIKKAGQNSERNKPKKIVTCNVLEGLIFHTEVFVLFYCPILCTGRIFSTKNE